MPVFEYEQAAL
jgi:hypothetical protein